MGRHFSLLAQRKVTKRKCTPGRRSALNALTARRSRGNSRGRLDVASCADEPKPAIPGRFTPGISTPLGGFMGPRRSTAQQQQNGDIN